ncbi:MAG TPA: replication-relaxation family protein [Streptosporangiaceae bacterium]|nr:replication-relaxation family protein [Streptosporangiaceae bacterium]
MTSTTRDTRARHGGPDALDLLGRLTERDLLILATLADHQALTTAQVTDLAFGSLRAAQQRLATLTRLGAVGRFRRTLPAGSEPWKYYLAPVGAALIAAGRGQPPPAPAKVRARAVALAASPRLGHLLGVNGFFTALAAAARASGGTCALTDWWSERRCAAEYGDIVRPDGYGTWTCHGQATGFFLEYDNATETTARAAAKLAQYADLATAEETPVLVLFWLPSPAREAALRPALARAATGAVAVATATPAHGCPAGPVWLVLHATRRRPLDQIPAGLLPPAR